ncbi:hypothetical protein JJB99_11735 [Bradyrhizobium diazoefficiens]|uniref:hypothetical protein n=1 Tax=Bradyrhizobium diazoefficiens TaxID=1355477 RepID=UPI0019099C4A|nr:hypothetical protein [Bradyrhizobium diazoefficiens]QQO18412.1 hypothetical protein JJB99_11735 [Bradyrhizobium diazoefficiens]
MFYAPADRGQHPRHNGPLDLIWNILDLTPHGRGVDEDWPKLDDEAFGQTASSASAQINWDLANATSQCGGAGEILICNSNHIRSNTHRISAATLDGRLSNIPDGR